MPWCVSNASNQVVEEKFKCSGVFPNAWNVFKCCGMPSSAIGCLQVVWGAWKKILCSESLLVRNNSSLSLVRCKHLYLMNSYKNTDSRSMGGAASLVKNGSTMLCFSVVLGEPLKFSPLAPRNRAVIRSILVSMMNEMKIKSKDGPFFVETHN